MRIRPGTIVTFLCFSLAVYALVAAMAVHRITKAICALGGRPPASAFANHLSDLLDKPVSIVTLIVIGMAGKGLQLLIDRIAGQHRVNRNQCAKCAWPRTLNRDHCPRCGFCHVAPMRPEARFEVLLIHDRPQPLRR